MHNPLFTVDILQVKGYSQENFSLQYGVIWIETLYLNYLKFICSFYMALWICRALAVYLKMNSLLRWNLHAIQLTSFRYTIQWFLRTSWLCRHHHSPVLGHFHLPEDPAACWQTHAWPKARTVPRTRRWRPDWRRFCRGWFLRGEVYLNLSSGTLC